MDTSELVSQNKARYLELHEHQSKIQSLMDRYQALSRWITETQEMALRRDKPEPIDDPLYVKAVNEYKGIHLAFLQAFGNYNEYKRIYNWLCTTAKVFPEEFSTIIDIPQMHQLIWPIKGVKSELLKETENKELFLPNPIPQPSSEQITNNNITTIIDRRNLNNNAINKVMELLKIHGTTHFYHLVTLLKEDGWHGYPIEDDTGQMNAKPLYNAMQFRAREKNGLKNDGNNYWSLIHKVEKESL